MKSRLLAVWSGQSPEEGPPRLTLSQVLYAPPNPDRSRKACRNCLLWCEQDACLIHEAGVVATAESVCGYHVFGTPGLLVGQWENTAPVTPEYSGLVQTRDGSCCEECRHYQPTPGHPSGLCQVTYETEPDQTAGESHAMVEALGCCCAWEPRLGQRM